MLLRKARCSPLARPDPLLRLRREEPGRRPPLAVKLDGEGVSADLGAQRLPVPTICKEGGSFPSASGTGTCRRSR